MNSESGEIDVWFLLGKIMDGGLEDLYIMVGDDMSFGLYLKAFLTFKCFPFQACSDLLFNLMINFNKSHDVDLLYKGNPSFEESAHAVFEASLC